MPYVTHFAPALRPPVKIPWQLAANLRLAGLSSVAGRGSSGPIAISYQIERMGPGVNTGKSNMSYTTRIPHF